jgi:AcrR family transcriptional regulator
MSFVADHIETDVRERILVTAERLFREIGYQKTTVADIAKALRMSPANVYRFDSEVINTGVARRLMSEVNRRWDNRRQQGRRRHLLFSGPSDEFGVMLPFKRYEMVACADWKKIDVCKALIEVHHGGHRL